MKLVPGSFFWRTLAVLVVALVASQGAAFLLFRQQVQQPRMGLGIGQFVSHLKTISAALESLEPAASRAFVERLAEREGIRVFPVRGDEPVRPAPDHPGLRMFRERIKGLFGPEAEVFVRQGTPGVLWVRLPTARADYWVGFPRNRVDRNEGDALLYWILAGVAIAIAATGLIAWRLNRPLARLAKTAEALGEGKDPPPVPETGPSEVKAVARAFNDMKERLKGNERERTTFLAGISHDLRTPLARLRLDVEMLEGKVEPQVRKDMIADLEDMNAIIDQFIDYARSEATEPFSPVDLGQLAREGAERAARAGTAIRCELAEDLPVLMLRPLAVSRLVANLVQNALKHGGGEILLAVARGEGEVRLSVSDRGPGIAAADIERLKEPFTRKDEARSGQSGAGLGLAIVARIAKAHGARFDLKPREGGGLVAEVVFPVAA